MSDECKMILEMVQEGRITPDEALALLDALKDPPAKTATASSSAKFRINPMVTRSGESKRRFWVQRVAGDAPQDGKVGPTLKRVELPKGATEDLTELLRAFRKSEE